MEKKILIGISDFEKFIENGGYFIDKSLIIKEVINDGNQIILLPRSRRFGKTLNLSMLKYFFELQNNKKSCKHLFKDLQIEKELEFKKHQGKYPVIFLTFKDVKDLNYKEAYNSICDIVSIEYKRLFSDYINCEKLDSSEKDYISRMITAKGTKTDYKKSLGELSKLLRKVYNSEIIILIDEYDTPIHTAYQNGYYKEMISFMRIFLSKGLKDNKNLYKSVITGILRVSKESIFSGLNLLGVYSLISYKYSTYFGLTTAEVKAMLDYYDNSDLYNDIKSWYDGYRFGETKIYNPWSVINYLENPKEGLKPYWVNTASNELLRELVQQGGTDLRADIQILLEGKELEMRELDDNIEFGRLRNERNHAISFLYFTGHLTYTEKFRIGDKDKYNLKIPNKEVAIIYNDIIQHWLSISDKDNKFDIMLKSITTGDYKLFEKIFSFFVLDTLSYFDATKKNEEAVYQAFILGALLKLKEEYLLKSNKESGYGRYDICLIPKEKTKTGIIMELKTIDTFNNETKEEALESGLRQIEEKKYATELISAGIKKIDKIAVTFDGKRCWLKTRTEGIVS
jgi:hypothetical protein